MGGNKHAPRLNKKSTPSAAMSMPSRSFVPYNSPGLSRHMRGARRRTWRPRGPTPDFATVSLACSELSRLCRPAGLRVSPAWL